MVADARRPDRRARVFRILSAYNGLFLIASALGAEWLMGRELGWDAARLSRLAIGLAFLGVSVVLPAPRISAAWFRSTAGLAAILLVLAGLEGGFRAVGYRFDEHIRAFERTPPFYRMPTEPVCEVSFRRRGPDSWTGQVLASQLLLRGGVYTGYRDDPEITVRYDRDGFRNPDDLTDWDIVVVGDSFTELGYLDHADLFTTRMQERLGVKVRNLSASYTGPFTYVCYLREYGKAESTRHAVLVFAETSDFQELINEDEALRRLETSGVRETRELEPHSSLIRALTDSLVLWRRLHRKKDYQNAVLDLDGRRVPISLKSHGPSLDDLGEAEVALIDTALAQWAETARAMEMKPWLLYVPSKHRVYPDRVRFTERAKPRVRNWRPTPVSELVERAAAAHGIEFVDALPRLREHALRGELLYNPIYDVHLNREGSHVIGDLMAERMSRARAGKRAPLADNTQSSPGATLGE